MDWRKIYEEKLRTSEEAVRVVKNGDRIYIGMSASLCYGLTDALAARKDELSDITIISNTANNPLIPFEPECLGPFSCLGTFVGNSERKTLTSEWGDYISMHLSQSADWVRETCRPNVAFLDVSLPDEEGYMSLGASGVGMSGAVIGYVDTIVAQVNRFVPYVYGDDARIHVSEVDIISEIDRELCEVPQKLDETSDRIAQGILELIPDGATIQLGIGAVTNAIGYGLMDKNDLGVHTEMFTDSMMMLMKHGNVTNRLKTLYPGVSLAAMAFGSAELYRFLDHNRDMYFKPFSYVNDPYVIGQNDRMISVNAAMAVDLYGQVAADNIGGAQRSGIGGQVDFVRGAQLSRGGKSIIALSSTRMGKGGPESRIVVNMPSGTAITTSRADVQYIATEYGCINLKLLTMKERARALISLAHPDFRDELSDEARRLHMI